MVSGNVTNEQLTKEQLFIGEKILEIRKDVFQETRQQFAKRCGLTPSYLGKLERGNVLISIKALVQISVATSASTDFILFGLANQKPSKKRKKLHRIVDKASSEEINIYFDSICKLRKLILHDRL